MSEYRLTRQIYQKFYFEFNSYSFHRFSSFGNIPPWLRIPRE